MAVTLVEGEIGTSLCVFDGEAAAKAFEKEQRNQQHLVRGSSHFY